MPEAYKVTIGIPTLNNASRLDRCLSAIQKYTPLGKFEAGVLVCDDGSQPDRLAENKVVAQRYQVPMLMNQARLGVAESWNRLARHGILNWGSDVLVIMNDDVEVVPDWLDVLVFSVRKNPHAGMVGLNGWQGVNSLNFTPPPVPAYNEAVLMRGYGLLSCMGFCFALAADKYNAVGGIDARYRCFYEELDLALSLLHKGWPSYIASHPIVIHQGGATTSDPANIDAALALKESRAKFKEKWISVAHQREIFKDRTWPPTVNWNTGVKNLDD